MPTPIYVVDAFTKEPFSGNPAGICILENPAKDNWMQLVAAEMKHAETAFLYRDGEVWNLRWFTPEVEVDLCGHATLASAHILYETGRATHDEVLGFSTKSGLLTAERMHGDQIMLDFPTEEPIQSASELHEQMQLALQTSGIKEIRKNRMDWFVVFETASQVRALQPDFAKVRDLGMRAVIATAQSDDSTYDFISRLFAPQSGIEEDPVTGSAHCALAPYWGAILNKTDMTGFQASSRGGYVSVEWRGDRTSLIGDAVTILSGEFHGSR
ncbi:MAG: PhzF family phenazine biosynthesis protein [Fimbriimonadaceae bacterium]|nr:PhzF family phenazine biosynthesis protein [Fimbriimonadaceae bacterium]